MSFLSFHIGPDWTFWGYAASSLLGLVFILILVPETRGRSLEAISAGWSEKR